MAAVVVVCSVAALPAQEPAQPAPEIRARIFPFELHPSTPDDELLEVARAADVNLFVDTTAVPEVASQVQTQWPGKHDWSLETLLSDISSGRRLAWDIQNTDQALLLSAEPNLEDLRQKMLRGPGIDVATPKLDEAAFNARLIDYLRREQGWKGNQVDWNKTIPIADLPPDLREEVLARTQQAALRGLGVDRVSMMRDETWKQARLSIGSQKAVGGPDTVLLLSTPTPLGPITSVLSELPQRKAVNRR